MLTQVYDPRKTYYSAANVVLPYFSSDFNLRTFYKQRNHALKLKQWYRERKSLCQLKKNIKFNTK